MEGAVKGDSGVVKMISLRLTLVVNELVVRLTL